jgi:hypothetical protein
MIETKKPPYEEAAEIVTGLSGWVCKGCRRYWAEDEHMARWCCAGTLPCETKGCQARVEKHTYMYCSSCMEKRDLARWLERPEVAWDGKTPLVMDDDDHYFFSAEDLDEYIADKDLKIEDLRLMICVEENKPYFEMYSFLDDYLAEGMDNEADWDKIDKVVNDWIKENVPTVWVPGKTRPTLDSVKAETA